MKANAKLVNPEPRQPDTVLTLDGEAAFALKGFLEFVAVEEPHRWGIVSRSAAETILAALRNAK